MGFWSFMNGVGKAIGNSFDPLNLTGALGENGISDSILSQVWDQFKNGQANVINKQIAEQNLGFQRENLDYQKALQQQIFEREDTSYARTASDMRMAGLNPLSMQGTNSAGEAIQTESLNNGFNYKDTGDLQAISKIFDTLNQINSIKNNTTLTSAQANLINAQANNQNIKNVYEEDLLKNTISGLKYSNTGKQFENERNRIGWLNDLRNYSFLNNYGLSENMPDFLKVGLLTSNQKGFTNKQNLSKLYSPEGLGSQGLPQLFSDSSKVSGSIMQNKIIDALLSVFSSGLGGLFSSALR